MKYYWIIHTLAYGSLVFLLLPLKYIKKLFRFAVLGGIIYTWVLQMIAVNVLSLWKYSSELLLMFFGVPAFFITSWFVVVFIYGFLLLNYPKFQLYLVIFFALWSTITYYFAVRAKVIIPLEWDVMQTFLLGILSHVVLLFFLKWLLKVKYLGVNEDLLLLKRS